MKESNLNISKLEEKHSEKILNSKDIFEKFSLINDIL
jgi:hypothetical protein